MTLHADTAKREENPMEGFPRREAREDAERAFEEAESSWEDEADAKVTADGAR